jgi:thiamine biosynthesis lipoprotein
VEQFAREHERDTRVVYVISGSAAHRAAELVRERAIKVAAYADPRGEFADFFHVEVTPTVLAFSAEGEHTGTYESIAELGDGDAAAAPGLRAVVDAGEEIGTTYHVVILATDEAAARRDLAAARDVVHEAESHLSEWKEDSDISRLNREAGTRPVEVEGDLLKVIKGSREVSQATGGAFDITWMPLGELWQTANASGRTPDQAELREVLAAVGYDKVVVEGSMVSFRHPGTRIGLGGVGKGWIVDAVFLHLRKRGYENIIVNIGGDVRTCGQGLDGPWTFKISDPHDPSRTAGTFELQEGSVATSGNYLRYLEIDGRRYGHILDPRTGMPAVFDGSVTVFAPDCAMADALATALFVMGPEQGLEWVGKHPGIEVIFATRDGLKSSLKLND